MPHRTRVLFVVVLGALGAFLLDRLFFSPWLERWDRLSEDIRKVDEGLGRAGERLAQRKSAEAGWGKVRTLLDRPRTPDVKTHFMSHLGAVCDTVGVRPDIQGTRTEQQSDFREYVYETKFQLTWEQLVRLLRELNNSKEFLKPMRIAVTSQYEREDKLVLDLKVSTIEYAPAAPRPGAPR
jgi:hypothetical protein